MKTSQRRHLKTNEVAATLARLVEWWSEHQRTVIAGCAVVALLLVAWIGMAVLRGRTADRADAMLAEAMSLAQAPIVPVLPPAEDGSAPPPPPEGSFPTESARSEATLAKLLEVVRTYPDSAASWSATYQAASLLAELGRLSEAEAQYAELARRGGSALQVRLARLGQATAQIRQGQHDAGIATLQELATAQATDLPVDGVLMELGRAYVAAGRVAEAKQTFQRVTDEFATSPYAQAARQEIEALGGTDAPSES